jgi:hypothetical protein
MDKFFELLKRISLSLWFRVAFAITIPTTIVIGANYLYHYGNPFFCIFKKITGFYCPSCGSGRAVFCLLHLDFLKALDYNFFAVIFLPLILYYGIRQYVFLVFKKNILPIFTTSIKAYNCIILLLVLFSVLRNIPVFPFTVLAP